MMFTQRSTLLKKRYRRAKIFQFTSIFTVLLCVLILTTFLLSIAKSAVMPLRSVEVYLDNNARIFIQEKLQHKNIYHYFPRSLKYQLHGNDSGWTPVKYDLKKYHITGVIKNPTLTKDFNKIHRYFIDKQNIRTVFNWKFFTNGNSIYPEIAGVKSALAGSLLVLIVFVCFTIPIGILVGLYISEFLPQGKRKSIFQINIQNLASIPSIIYGIIVLNIFINTFGFMRSSALVGGIALSLLILPMIVMITYNSASMVPQGYKDSSLALGVSNVQTVFLTTLPLAMPRIITGILLAIARAAGETAPLLMVGLAFFSTSVPSSITNDAATTLPLQIFLWSGNPQESFIEHASAAILVFILFLTTINLFVHFIRSKLNKV